MENRYLFRGKRVDNGEWGYGYYVCYGSAMPVPKHIIHEPDNLNRLNGLNFEINPGTLGQCTGLTASKSYRGESAFDRLIFEGDIVQEKNNSRAAKCEIEWYADGWKRKVFCKRYGGYDYLPIYSDGLQIISTIYDDACYEVEG